MWAWVTDTLLSLRATADTGAIACKAQINSFLQSWSPSVSHQSRLPHHLKQMLHTAKKHRVSFTVVKLSKRAHHTLPIWYHLGAVRKLCTMNNSPLGKCLRETHNVHLVTDLLPLRARPCLPAGPASSNSAHPHVKYKCPLCAADTGNGCRHPQVCCRFAGSLLAQMQPCWSPDLDLHGDGLSHMRGRKWMN